MPAWIPAFFTSIAVALATIPRLRRLALATGFVDAPASRKFHHIPIPYLGGVALILAVLAGQVFATRLGRQGAVLVLAAALLGGMGLIDDDRSVSPPLRLFAEIAIAVLAVSVGLRIHASGSTSIDILLTLLWLVGVTNAFNFLDNMDGLAGGVAAMASAAVFVLAVAARQPLIATLSAASVGACLGFLVYNRPPASIFMGDAGSLFLGFLLAVSTIDVRPNLDPPFSFLIPLMLLALPVLDTTLVTVARMRHGHSITEGGKDHISHRLVKRGLSSGRAVACLVGIEGLMGTLAVLGGRHVIRLWVAVLSATLIIAGLAVVAGRVSIYQTPAVGLPRKVRLAAAAMVVGVPILAAPALIALARAAGPAREAEGAARQALRAFGAGNGGGTAEFERAARSFGEAEDRLSGPLPLLGLAVPGLSSNLTAAKTLVSVGRDLSIAGARLGELADPSDVPVRNGTVSLEQVRQMTGTLNDGAEVLSDARVRLSKVERAFLLPPLRRAVNELTDELVKKEQTVGRAANAAALLPGLLGGDGPRHYFAAFQNNAELRGSGGFIGNWGELVADSGQLRMDRFGRLRELIAAAPPDVQGFSQQFKRRWQPMGPTQWSQINVSPDFPTTAQAIGVLYPQSGGRPVDGVVAIDPVGLSALLTVTGPVQVAGWPEPITAGNVVDVTLKEAYAEFPLELSADMERAAFLSDLAQAVIQRFTTADLGNVPQLISALSRAVVGGHLMVYMNDPQEQALMSRLGIDGRVPELRGDSVLVVNQNMAANKIDPYLQRRVQYDFKLKPEGSTVEVSGRTEVTLTNAATLDLPLAVIGPYMAEKFKPAENRTYLSLYSPFLMGAASLDGQPIEAPVDVDLWRRVQSAEVSVGGGESRTLRFNVKGKADLSEGGWYRLDLLRQPALNPDDVELNVSVAAGWRIAEARGAPFTGSAPTTARVQLDAPRTIWLRLEPTGLTRVWERLFR